jgi:hypothetical protein
LNSQRLPVPISIKNLSWGTFCSSNTQNLSKKPLPKNPSTANARFTMIPLTGSFLKT